MSSDPARFGSGDPGGRGRSRVLIVDDSSTIRRLLRDRLSADPRLEVVGEAADPIEARAMIKALSPDVLTLDVEMPTMNGLDFLEKLMRLRPMPVVMISTETHRGSASAIEALALGAVDCVGKPNSTGLPGETVDLADIVVQAARARVRPGGASPRITPPADFSWGGKIVLIGSSTGGVEAIETVLSGFPANCPPTLIAQHMPEAFLASFAERLAARMRPKVRLARDGEPLAQGHVFLAPGGDVHLEVRTSVSPECRLSRGEKRNGHRPSVDVLFGSAVPLAERTVAVILTGMGRDGAQELATLRAAGARTIAQDAATSVVYGMPRAALDLGGVESELPLHDIGRRILALASQHPMPAGRTAS
ncbi:MAG: chemotaxis response regulator protein-glutamate methylesterase [Paracoccaceae bacterium]